jgi:hypothetical protein
MSLSGEVIYMNGLLSTPFHRVYFQNQSKPRIENLPGSRLKFPIGLRLNYYPTDNLILRSYYRYFSDDFGIHAHTLEFEIPVKLGQNWILGPFYRYHTQTQSDYFKPYGNHQISNQYYSSDYDLSKLNSHKVGISIKYSPVYRIGSMKVLTKMLLFDEIEIRGGVYSRTPDLNAGIVSMRLGFKIGG